MADPKSFVATLQTATAEQKKNILDSAVGAGTGAATAVTAAAAAKPLAPGKERWPVKVGTDTDVDKVGQSGTADGGAPAGATGVGPVQRLVVDTSVRELGAIPRPDDLMPATAQHPDYQQKRAAPVETTVWRVHVQVIALRLEQDGDYHLVLQDDSGATMVAEVPLDKPNFVPPESPFSEDIAAARAAVDGQFKNAVAGMAFVQSIAHLDPKVVPMATFGDLKAVAPINIDLQTIAAAAGPATLFAMRIDPTPAIVTGVGFFDYDHGQTGNAPNILELHPVLKIEFTS